MYINIYGCINNPFVRVDFEFCPECKLPTAEIHSCAKRSEPSKTGRQGEKREKKVRASSHMRHAMTWAVVL